MKPASMALLRTFSPHLWHDSLPWTARGCLAHAQSKQQKLAFSSSLPARKKGPAQKKDPRISVPPSPHPARAQIRYHLQHPLTPRPLRFSRTRALRHWTIHRAWMRYQDKLRRDRELQLERQYNSMAAACEALRLIDGYGLTTEERAKLGEPRRPEEEKDEGRLYRIAMLKDGIWKGVPIEYAKIQTDTPAREPWNHAWTR